MRVQYKTWTARERDSLDAMILEGKSHDEAAKALGRTKWAIVSAVRRFDLQRRLHDGNLRRRQIAEYLLAGEFNTRLIARKIGVHKDTVIRYVNKLIGECPSHDAVVKGRYDREKLMDLVKKAELGKLITKGES